MVIGMAVLVEVLEFQERMILSINLRREKQLSLVALLDCITLTSLLGMIGGVLLPI